MDTRKKNNAPDVLKILLIVIDIALLAVILTSVLKNEDTGSKPYYVEVPAEESMAENKAGYSEPVTVPSEEPMPYDTEGIDGIEDIKEEQFNVSDYSTTNRPSLSDFMWYFDNVHYNGIPENAEYIYDSEQLVGDWKGFIFYDPDRKMNSYGIEFLNVNLDIQGRKADVAFDLFELHFEDTEVINEEGGPILRYSGNFEAGALYASGGGNVHIDTFYTMPDRKQYAVGYIDTPDGTPAYLAMVRP